MNSKGLKKENPNVSEDSEIPNKDLFNEISLPDYLQNVSSRVHETTLLLPSIPGPNTIRKQQLRGETLPASVAKNLITIGEINSELNFAELTVLELSLVSDYAEKLRSMSYKDKFKLIRKYVGAGLLNDTMSSELRAKINRFVTRVADNDEYLPTESLFSEIMPYILKGSPKLFDNNVNLTKGKEKSGRPNFINYKDPLNTFLLLKEIQEKAYIPRAKEIKEAIMPMFEQTNTFHSLFVIWLNMNDIPFGEFFGKLADKIKENIRTLRSIMFDFKIKGSLTPKQSSLVIDIIDDYSKVIRDFYALEENLKIKSMLDELLKLPEPKKIFGKTNIETALANALEYFNISVADSSLKGYKILVNRSDKTVPEVLNLMAGHKVGDKNNIDKIACRKIVEEYFSVPAEARTKYVEEKIMKVKKSSNIQFASFEIVPNMFFAIIDKHI